MARITKDQINSIIGQQFGRLAIIDEAPRSEWRNRNRHYVCLCECGNKKIISWTDLRSGNVNSCGCLKKEKLSARQSTHGNSKHPLYAIWNCMIHRCENPNMHSYKKYGAKGITVCDRWHTFEHFVADMGERPSMSHSIDRIDGDLGYSKENCRWATHTEQQHNRKMPSTYSSCF